MDQVAIQNIRNSWDTITQNETGLSNMMMFYGRLFEMAPETKKLFSGSLEKQSEKLAYTVSFVVSNINRLEDIKESVEDLGRIHNKLRIDAKYYPMVRDSLIFTIKSAMGSDYTEEIGKAWYDALNLLSDIMINAPEQRTNRFQSLIKKLFG